jgi:hypothetical protein
MATTGRGVAPRVGLPATPGLAELLDGRAQFEDVVRLDPRSTAQVIAAGKPDETSREQAAERVLRALDDAYEIVLVHADTPAALVGTQAEAWAVAVLVSDGERSGAAAATAAALAKELGLQTLRYERGGNAVKGVLAKLPFARGAAAAI